MNAAPDEKSMARLRLDLAYDGTDFTGWARQPGRRTVEAELVAALTMILRAQDAVALTVAGRTDAGVHARGQVVHLDVPLPLLAALPGRSSRSPSDALVSRLAGVLPRDVVVFSAREVPRDFDARFGALDRTYRYRISDRPETRLPTHRSDVLWLRYPLDLEAMRAATPALLGEHDFLPYCRPRPGASTVRDLIALEWDRDQDGLVVATVTADAFCRSMVRSLVGAFLAVGSGKQPIEWPAEVLARGDRVRAAPIIGPQGLTLESVRYPPDDDLARRAAGTRAVRGAIHLPALSRKQNLGSCG